MDKKDTNLLWVKIKMTNTTVYLHIYINVSVYLTIVVLAPPRFCISSSWPAFVQLPTINEQAWRRRMLQFNYFLFTNHWKITEWITWLMWKDERLPSIDEHDWGRVVVLIFIFIVRKPMPCKLYDITPKYTFLGVLFKYLPVPRPVGPIQSTTGVKINRRDPPHL